MSKMVKLLTLVAVVAALVAPTLLLAEKGEKPYSLNEVIKDYGTVTASFEKAGITIPGFKLARKVISEPTDTTLYYKEGNNAFWTWSEGYEVIAPAAPKDLGYFTYRPPATVTPTVTKGKIYKAIPPEQLKTGWKRGVESVRSK